MPPPVAKDKMAALARELLAKQQAKSTRPPEFLDPDFPEQNAFILDPAKFKMLLCSRRSGKSYGAGRYLLKMMWDVPRCNVLFLGLTKQSAVEIIWKDILIELDAKLGLGCKINLTDHTLESPNGSMLYISGVDVDEGERRKILGKKFRLVFIDEGSSFSIDVRDLVYGVLQPAVADYEGTICIAGMPSNLKFGLFYDGTKGQDPQNPGQWEWVDMAAGVKWKGHRWSALLNPHMREKVARLMAEMRALNPRIDETPRFQQHWLGRWVIDDEGHVYKFEHSRNTFDGKLPIISTPTGRWHFVLGVDLGFNDDTAFVVMAYHDFSSVLYFLECHKEPRLDFTDTANRIKAYQVRFDFDSLIVDGANKQGVEEMRKRHGLPLEAAEKRDKAEFIDLMNDDFCRERIKIDPVKCSLLIEEYANLVWDERELKRGKRVEHPASPNHAADGANYGWRFCYNYLADKVEEKPASGTSAWFAQQEAVMQEQAMRRAHHLASVDSFGDGEMFD